jgi:branched-chain amino acid transport system permease protein
MSQLLVAGITVGCVYALIALSFAPSYSTSRIINFAQGELVMLGCMSGAVVGTSWHLPYFVGLIPVLGLTATVNGLLYLLVVRSLLARGAAIINVVIATLVFGVLIRVVVSFLFGLDPQFFPPPFSGPPFQIADFYVARQALVIVFSVLIILALTWTLYTKSLVGLLIHATADNRDVAQLVSVNVERLTLLSYLASGMLAGMAGYLYGPLVNAAPSLGLQFALWGFSALIIGGIGSWAGPVVAGLLLGVIETFANFWVGTGSSEVLTVGVVLVFLYVRPTGLLGRVEHGGAVM